MGVCWYNSSEMVVLGRGVCSISKVVEGGRSYNAWKGVVPKVEW